ncbi:DNA mismatch endonuclease Vsr [Sphingomonas sp.]|jgi:DNA mismatch endonuclease (patch repair protein)|uniref:very short patch repair endonuclease n=1 Tax=Sphingomonas sp. TaxID=28214 RepID=UPI002ED92EC9
MDSISPERRSANMRQIKSRDTKPEMVVRRTAHRLGYRYRLHRKDLPGKPDLVFPGRSKIIFVHGCFWHQHAEDHCRHGRPPRSNLGYWRPKLARNVARDADATKRLAELGWCVLTLWECEVRDDAELAQKLREFLD